MGSSVKKSNKDNRMKLNHFTIASAVMTIIVSVTRADVAPCPAGLAMNATAAQEQWTPANTRLDQAR